MSLLQQVITFNKNLAMNLPLFPLRSVFYPGETVPLHIFEDRYKDLIKDCRAEAMTFGIPVFIDNEIKFGTEVQLVEVVNTYDGGEMDVVCVARQVFKVLTFDNPMEGKTYAGGLIEFLESDFDAPVTLRQLVLSKIEELYELMGVELPKVTFDKFNSYAFAHKMGLSFEQEYELLQLTNETKRLNYLNSHLNTTIEILKEINRTKSVIEMNGHFKNFDPLDFEDYNAN